MADKRCRPSPSLTAFRRGDTSRRVRARLVPTLILFLGCGSDVISSDGGAGGISSTSSLMVSSGSGTGTTASSSGSGEGGSLIGGSGGIGGFGVGGFAAGGEGGLGGSGGGFVISVGALVPDFGLVDQNPASATASQTVSPRDYLMRVSGWYFGHAT